MTKEKQTKTKTKTENQKKEVARVEPTQKEVAVADTTQGWNFGQVDQDDLTLASWILIQGATPLKTEFRGELADGDIWDVTNQKIVWKYGQKPIEFVSSKIEKIYRRYAQTVLPSGEVELEYFDTIKKDDKGAKFQETIDGQDIIRKEVHVFDIHPVGDLKENIVFPKRLSLKGASLSESRKIITGCVRATIAKKTPAHVLFELSTKSITSKQKSGKSFTFFGFKVNELGVHDNEDWVKLAKQSAEKTYFVDDREAHLEDVNLRKPQSAGNFKEGPTW